MKRYYIRIKTKEQLKEALTYEHACAFLIPPALLSEFSGQGVYRSLFLDLPEVARESRIEGIRQMVRTCPEGVGVVVKNLDELGILQELDFQGPVIADAFLYAYNIEAVRFYQELFPEIRFLCSDELTDRELKELAGRDCENRAFRDELTDRELKELVERICENSQERVNQTDIHWPGAERTDGIDRWIYKAYGRQLLMVTNQCLSRNYTNCRAKRLDFRDERGNVFTAASDCDQCYSLIYHGKSTSMLDRLGEVPFENILLDFTLETADEVRCVLNGAQTSHYRGHHDKGIE